MKAPKSKMPITLLNSVCENIAKLAGKMGDERRASVSRGAALTREAFMPKRPRENKIGGGRKSIRPITDHHAPGDN